jgi:hypothetical protein
MVSNNEDNNKTIRMPLPSKDEQQTRTEKRQKRRVQEREKVERTSPLKAAGPKRLFPIWLRILIIIALIILSTMAGMIIGYGFIGDGKPMDALNWDTWQHILDLINKDA